ncbi:CU044_5270 family protein [Protofrankia symbiont of Coriaria ruscifolia]|uniref:Putative membrane protein n=1 Tax=Candidatus Protofrankia californiensis TaxID=1839754 RepID=A0A1C3PEI1_9ACTN|nr:CU044_5270 family protein [Protofrankia symbiont of Coriaria ruscifolia]SBW28058.1 putative membrane protein [Candidatus Protofrankia californiensis]
MIGNVKAVRRILSGHDPADDPNYVLGNSKAATLERVFTSPNGDHNFHRSRLSRYSWARRATWLASAGMAVVLVVFFLTQFGLSSSTPPPTAQAATPRLLAYSPVSENARDVLIEIASQIRTNASSLNRAEYRYVKTESWSLSTRIDGRQVRSAVLPEIREVWRAPDGSGRVRIIPGTPEFPSDEARRAWQDEERPTVKASDETFHAGELVTMYPSTLPTDADAMAALFAAGHPASNGPAETLVAATDLYLEQTPAAPARAAVLEVLANTSGLQLQGRTVDRIGRSGLAFSVDSSMSGLPTRYILIIDPTDGRLLDQEQVLITSAGALNVPIPSTISYVVFADAAHTSDTRNRT